MTALCGGGTSQQKPGTPQAAYVAGSELALYISTIFGIPAWVAIAAYAAAQEVVLSTLCSTDPPAMPSFSAADITDILNPTPLRDSPAAHKLDDLCKIALWYVFCQCAPPTSTPAAPAAPTYPPTAPTINPPSAPPLSNATCWQYTHTHNMAFGFPTSSACLPTGADRFNPTTPGAFIYPEITNASALIFKITINSDGTVNGAGQFEIQFRNASGTLILDYTQNVALGATGTTTLITPPAGWDNGHAFVNSLGPSGQNNSATVTASVWCGANHPGTPTPACCPPDPSLQAQLDQIFSMLAVIYQSLPSNASSYAESTVHTGLSGNGSIVLASSAIGVKVDITTDVPAYGLVAGDPDYLFNRGYITLISAEAPQAGGGRLTYNPQVFPTGPLIDSIGYSLPAGLVIKITELTAGP